MRLLLRPRSQHYDLATRIAMERENTKYWARILLLFPLAPVFVALSTVVIGGVVINAATNKCNASLMSTSSARAARFLSRLQHLVCVCSHCYSSGMPRDDVDSVLRSHGDVRTQRSCKAQSC